MNFKETYIKGLLVIEPNVFKDPRGYFFESYSKEKFREIGIDYEFVQDNQSLSQQGALRGMHFQAPPYDQGKLVKVTKGSVLDVAVDIRKNSDTYGRHFCIELSESNFRMFWIPPGFAHGFLTLQDNTIFQYKCTNVYNKASEGGLLWNDPDLDIDWGGVTQPLLSEKDKLNSAFKDFESPF